ncbi:DUF3857 domain-containing protein [Flavobacterium sp. SUN046]|uniref:DUF3857 domain-containing protein n=1 Tax=Flavobacterium sp. SUN046 TaxID=3002440 RepID=UPI002DC03FC2|nr:DUF3857 domain-containing protein [Flavobacterium sp. SUN046]MEC4049236.1 DUF3857 domain-containing protein [Flavobacterium sp. SUN046]
MKIKALLLLIALLSIQLSLSQKIVYGTLPVPENLKENANSVILNQEIEISIVSQKLMRIKKYKVIRVYNAAGLRNIDASEYYDKSNKIKWLDATIYNYSGKEVKNFKQRDFKDHSIADGYTVFSDDRMVYLDYTPTEYPFTIIYYSETESTNTAFIPSWNPIDDYNESAIKSSFTIDYPQDLGFKYKEINLSGNTIIKKEDTNKLSFVAENVIAQKREEYAPAFEMIIPHVLFGLEKSTLEGIEISTKSWEEFGASWYKNILADTEELPEETKQKIKELIGNETDPIKKIKKIYKYVQDKTRYVSIQLGIGGWKPMYAKDVDRLGYGDCKALSNYTRVLLKEAGIDSNLTIIYGGNKKDITSDFVCIQGNHAILTIPLNNKLYFLECTSQTDPFNYQGTFTDGRYALMITPEKGEIIKTNTVASIKENAKTSKGHYAIDEYGNLKGGVTSVSKGIQYNDYHLESKSKEEIDNYYKDNFSWINNLKIEKVKFNNNKDIIEFTEDLQISAANYATPTGNLLMLPINVFNQYSHLPQRYRNRKNPFEIQTSFYDEDEIDINIPENYIIDSKPEDLSIKGKFGEYNSVITVISPNKLHYKRILSLNEGRFEKADYDLFRTFMEQIAISDNSKLVITKKP